MAKWSEAPLVKDSKMKSAPFISDPNLVQDLSSKSTDLAYLDGIPVSTASRALFQDPSKQITEENVIAGFYNSDQYKRELDRRRSEKSNMGASGYWEELIDATARGIARVGSSVPGAAASFSPMGIPTATGMFVPVDVKRQKDHREVMKQAQDDAKFLWQLTKNPDLAARDDTLSLKAINLIGETIPYITASTAAYAGVGPLGGFAVGSLVEGNASYRRAIDEGVDESTAKKIGLGVGIVSGAIESVGGKYTEALLMRASSKIRNKLAARGAQFTIGTVVEALEEGAQEVSQIAGEAIYQEVDWDQGAKRILGSMAGGAFLGGTMRGLSMGARGITKVSGMTETISNPQTPAEIEQDIEEIIAELREGPAPQTWDQVIKEAMKDSLKDAKKARKPIQEAQTQARSERAGAYLQRIQDNKEAGMSNYDSIMQAKSALKGPLTEYENQYEGLEQKVGPDVIEDAYADIIVTENLKPFEKVSTAEAFEKVVSGTYLTPGEAQLLVKWMPDLKEQFERAVPWSKKAWRKTIEIANVPRTMLTMFGDISGIGRQARALGMSDVKAYGQFIRKTHHAFFSEQSAKDLVKEYESSEFYDEAAEMGLDFSAVGEEAKDISELEERYISAPILEKIPYISPVIRASERAFSPPLNWLRMQIYEKVRVANPDMTKAEAKRLAQSINDLGGRSATARKGAVKYLSEAMTALFSPRFALSRIKLPYTVARPFYDSMVAGNLGKDLTALATFQTRGAFQVVARGVAGLIASNLAIMALVKWLWPDEVKIDTDLRSTDGGKIKWGDQRIDLWAGFLQPAQLAMRLATGQKKAQSGRVYDEDRKKLVEDFSRSKLAPLVALAIDAWKGETFWGRKFLSPPKGGMADYYDRLGVPDSVQGITTEVWNRVGPLIAQDISDALIDEGVDAAAMAGFLGMYGMGVATYEPWPTSQLHLTRNDVAKEVYSKEWDELKPVEQEKLKRRDDLKKAEAEALRARKEIGPRDIEKFVIEPQRKSSNRMTKAMPENIQKELRSLSMQVVGVQRRILSDFYLNDARYVEYERLAIDESKAQLERLFKSGIWQQMDYVSRVERSSKAMTKARKRARTVLLQKINRGEL